MELFSFSIVLCLFHPLSIEQQCGPDPHDQEDIIITKYNGGVALFDFFNAPCPFCWPVEERHTTTANWKPTRLGQILDRE
jgi:hypothetical protein